MDFTTIQGILALLTSAILVIQLLAGFFLGADSDIDVDGDSSADFDLSTVFSPKGILHFVCGSSWYLVCVGKSVLGVADYIIASMVGLLFMGIMIGVYWLMFKLECFKEEEKGEKLVGRLGTVYLNTGNGSYVIYTNINGSQRELNVISKDKEKILKIGTVVKISEYKEGFYYIE